MDRWWGLFTGQATVELLMSGALSLALGLCAEGAAIEPGRIKVLGGPEGPQAQDGAGEGAVFHMTSRF